MGIAQHQDFPFDTAPPQFRPLRHGCNTERHDTQAVQFFRNQHRSVSVSVGLDRRHKGAALREYGA